MSQWNFINARVQRINPYEVEISWEPTSLKPTISVFPGNNCRAAERKLSTDGFEAGCFKISDLNPLVRYYFSLENDHGDRLMTAERRVPLEGAVNFRDLGGYLTRDGRRVKWGKVFRSDGLSRLTDSDHQLIKNIGINRVIDFRTLSEASASPDRLPEDGSIKYENCPVSHGQIDFVEALKRLKEGDTTWLSPDFMVNGYISNIDNAAKTWGNVINELAVSDGDPILFHCTGGKDRTGTCAALILLILGVSEETVIEDHQLSNIYIADMLPKVFKLMASYGVDPQLVFPYLTAPKNCMVSMLEHIKEKYGSAENYLEKMAGVGRENQERVKEKLLV